MLPRKSPFFSVSREECRTTSSTRRPPMRYVTINIMRVPKVWFCPARESQIILKASVSDCLICYEGKNNGADD